MNMPKVQADAAEGTIKKWMKKVGDPVKKGEPVFSIAVGKLAKNINADCSGVIAEILAPEGAAVPCGAPVVHIEVQAGAEAGDAVEIPLTMPKMGAGATTGTVKKWFKKAGEAIAPGDVLFSMANGKLVKSVMSEWSGTLKSISVEAGETVPVDTVVGVVLGASSASEEAPGKDVSIVVIGGGPGGYVAAIHAAQLGAKVTLVEKKHIGGTCLNVGCIPTKALLHSAEVYYEATHSRHAGIIAENVKLDWDQVQANRVRISETLSTGVAGLLEANGVEVLSGTARFLSPTAVEVTGADGGRQELTADKFIIATGSVPVMPPIPGVAGNPDCIDSTGALQLKRLPKSMVLIGGGVIGVELACAYARFGTEVTIVEMMPRLLPTMDGELTELARSYMEKAGIRFSMETQVTSVEQRDGFSVVHGRLKDGTDISFEAEKILVAVGRRPSTDGLAPEAAGISCERGRILVNDAMETNVPNIYAIGDCNGKLMLAHTASMMGEIAAENAMGAHKKFDGSATPSCVYLFPDFAGVGMTGEQAAASGRQLEIGRFPMMANGKSLIMDKTEGMVKIIADKKNQRILGVHILGANATDLIAEAALAIQMKATVGDLMKTIHAHPTVAESVREAALAANGTPIHIHKD